MPWSLSCSMLSRSNLSQPPVMRSPQTALSLLLLAASIQSFSVSSQALSLPSQVKSRPSAPALSATSTLAASAVANSTTSAAARGLMSVRFLPKKPMPLPPCARRACVNISNSLLIFVVLLIVLRVIAMTCRIMLTVVLLYARQNVCVLYNKPLNLGVLVDDSLLFWLAVRFLRQTNVHLCLLKALFISEKASYHTR